MIPLCQQTRDLFKPLRSSLSQYDRLEVHSADKGGFVLDIYKYGTDRNGTPFRRPASMNLEAVIERLPEKKRLFGDTSDALGKHQPWLVGATDCTVELISALVPIPNLVFGDDDAKVIFSSILMQSQLADECARVNAEWEENKNIPEHEYELNADLPLSPYQQVALCNQQLSSGFGLFMEQGTGKTPVGIAAICNSAKRLRDSGEKRLFQAIIVCPNKVRTNWVTEFHNFATRPGRITVIKGTQLQRVKLVCDAIADDPSGELYYSVMICGYQTLWRTLESLQYIPWDLAMLDEGHAIKDAKAKQSQGCMEIRDHARQRIILTGTPIANTPLDLYNQLEFMDKGGSGFSTERAFRKFYGTFVQTASGRDQLIGCQNLPFLQERLARKSFFISLKEAQPDLPEKTYDLIEVEMSEQQQEAYNKLADELALEIENDFANDKLQRSMLVQNVLTKLLRLSQVTSGFISWQQVVGLNGEIEQPKLYEYFYPNPKIEAILEEICAKPPNEKTIVWCKWLPDIEYMASVCEQNNIGHCVIRGISETFTEADSAESERRFNEDRSCKVCIASIAINSGINLIGYKPHCGDEYDTDCTHVIHMSKGWSSIEFGQSVARAHRRGTRRPVRCTSIVVPDSIDTEIHERVTGKILTALDVSDLRKILRVALHPLQDE